MKLNWESPAHFENRIKPRGYVRRITCSTMHENLVTTGTGVRKNTSVPCGFSSFKIQKFMGGFPEHGKILTSFIASCVMLLPFVSLQSNLLLYWQVFYDVNVSLCNVSVTLSK